MGLSLRDQLLQAGFQEKKAEPKPAINKERHGDRPAAYQGKPGNQGKSGAGKGQHQQQNRAKPQAPATAPKAIDPNQVSLAHAYHLRAETEKREREEAQRRAEEAARVKREQRARLQQLVAGKALNDKEAEHVRNFSYGRKIRKVNVTADQLLAINRGDLGIAQVDGRFMVLEAALVREIIAFAAQHVAVFVPEGIGAADSKDDDYSDPKFQVPDDLVW